MRDRSFYQSCLDLLEIGDSIWNATPVSGGCINHALCLRGERQNYFLKYRSGKTDLFEKESLGLGLLRANSSLVIPKVHGKGFTEGRSFLLLEFLPKESPSKTFWKDFARGLASQHRITSEKFGLDHSNHIGRLDQDNTWLSSWYEFFRDRRLEPQLKQAEAKGLIDKEVRRKFEQLYPRLPELIPEEPPALLHGDLWSGNFLITSGGSAAIFDPAVYFGHRETELAFTHLFGGFDPSFYTFYDEVYPLESGFEDRIDLHNLYPLLVHVNLFGSGYLSGIVNTLRRYNL